MPKYYRFRATTPTRRPRRSKETDIEVEKRSTKAYIDRMWGGFDMTLACTPALSWYLRRTSWRETPLSIAFPRQLTAEMRASLQLSHRPIYVLKMPPSATYCQGCRENMRQL